MEYNRSSIQPLKKLPYTVAKKELKLLYPKETEKRLNYFATDVMAENRNKTYKEVRYKRVLLHNEWVKLIDILGYPDGYEKFFRG